MFRFGVYCLLAMLTPKMEISKRAVHTKSEHEPKFVTISVTLRSILLSFCQIFMTNTSRCDFSSDSTFVYVHACSLMVVRVPVDFRL